MSVSNTKKESRLASIMSNLLVSSAMPILLILAFGTFLMFGASYLINSLPDIPSLLCLDPKKRNVYEVGDGDHDYVLYVNTGLAGGAGTDANVRVTFFSKDGTKSTKPLFLNSFMGSIVENAFEAGDTDILYIRKTTDVGEPGKIEVTMDNSYAGAAWQLESIQLRTKVGDKIRQYHYPCDKFLGGSNPKTRFLENKGEPTLYRITFKIRNETEAGTDSDTYISLEGSIDILDEINGSEIEVTSLINDTADTDTALSRRDEESIDIGPVSSIGELKSITVTTGYDELNLEWIDVEAIPQSPLGKNTKWRANFSDEKFDEKKQTFKLLTPKPTKGENE